MDGIVLINPPLSLSERYGEFARAGTQTPPVGLAQLAAAIRAHGHETAIIDCEAEGLDYSDTVQRVLKLNCGVIGITAVTISICNAATMASELKAANPDLCIIIGGPHVTGAPAETMTRFPAFDIGVVGEGEVTAAELLDTLLAGGDLTAVRGLIFRKPDGELHVTPPRPFIEDLDSLPQPAWDLLPPLATSYETPTFYLGKPPTSSLITSRGCCGKCVFCDRSLFGNVCRMHSPERVLESMRVLHETYGINDVIIHDDAFVLNRNRVFRFCQLLRESGLGMTWGCNARVDMVNPDLLAAMRSAGCWHVAYGIESGSQRILDVIGKGTTIEQIEKAVRWAHEAGIRTRGFFMIGHPTETEESIRQTIAFAKSIPIDDFQITFFTPLPGSEIHRTIRRYGEFNDDWQALSMWEPVFVPEALTRDSLVSWHRRAYREFYIRPRVILGYARIVRSPRHMLKLARGVLTLAESLLRPRGPLPEKRVGIDPDANGRT